MAKGAGQDSRISKSRPNFRPKMPFPIPVFRPDLVRDQAIIAYASVLNGSQRNKDEYGKLSCSYSPVTHPGCWEEK